MPSVENCTYQLQKPHPEVKLQKGGSSYTINWNTMETVNTAAEGSLVPKGIVIERREYAKNATEEEIAASEFTPLITLQPGVNTHTDAAVESGKDYEYRVTYQYAYSYNKLESVVSTKGFVLYTNVSNAPADVGSGTSRLVKRIIVFSILVVLMSIMGVIAFVGFKHSRRSRWHRE